MCEHARSTGFQHEGRSPSSAGLHNACPHFPRAILTEEGCDHKKKDDEATGGGFYRRVYPSIRNMFLRLQQALHGIPLPHTPEKIASVLDMLEALDIDEKEWNDFARFDGKKYTRNLVAHDSAFTVLLLCWNKDQRSPIHDHSGSSCWVKVLKGKLRERRFAFPDLNNEHQALELTSDCVVSKGEVCYINDSQGIHEMGNPSTEEVTVTMHVYSPAYYSCFAFNEATGAHRCVSMLAAAAPQREVLGPEVDTIPNSSSTTTTTADGGSSGTGDCCGKKAAECRAPANSLSLPQFAKLIDNPRTTETQAVDAFNRLFLGKSEWSSFVHFNDHRFQRLMLHSNHRFSLLMLCWLPGQKTPPHDHRGSKSWVKVLSGQLFYHEVDEEGQPVDGTDAKLTRCMGAPFVEDDTLAVHVVGNNSETFAVSLHFYSPPYTDLSYTDLSGCGGKCTPPLSPKAAMQCVENINSAAEQLLLKHKSVDHASDSASESSDIVSHHVIPYAVCQQALNLIQQNGIDNRVRLLSNFFILQEKLGIAFSACMSLKDVSVAVLEILEEQIFSPQELEQYWQIRDRIDYRVRLHDSETFCVSLNLWDPEHESVIHDHDGSLSWLKVLDGALMDTLFEESDDGCRLEESNTSRLITGSVTFYGVKAKHALANISKSRRAISLHVYCSKSCVVDQHQQARIAAAATAAAATAGAQQDASGAYDQAPSRQDSAGNSSFFTNKRSLVMFGTQQACRWYTRGAPRHGIRVMSLTAVEDTNWKLGGAGSPTSPTASNLAPRGASKFGGNLIAN